MDYKKIGFKCGLEIHNRLATKHKLFCNCPPRLSEEKPVKKIKRKLRAVAGELGKVDVSALYEYLRNRTFYYHIFTDTTCLVEMDEEPPYSLNQEALEIALQIAKMLKCDIPEEIHIMRKTVIDGSNTAGFQRTAIIGLNGSLETSQGNVRITNVCLEEESAGIVEKKENEILYRLDRLGIPLIEIGTAPDIKNPEHAKEVAEKLGMIIRSTGKSQRGIGVTREDINISIKGGERIEVKGVQNLDLIPKIIENEVLRQIDLVKKGKSKKETRVAKQDGTTEYTRPLPGGERLYPETDIPPIAVKKLIKKIKLPETWEQKLKKFEKKMPKQLAEQILKSEYLDLFETLSKKHDPVFVANFFTSTLKDLKRKGIEIRLEDSNILDIFSAIEKKQISKESLPEIIEYLTKGLILREILEKLKPLSEKELREIIKKVIDKNKNLVKEKRISALIGEVMKTVHGRVEGKKVVKVLNEEIQK